MTLGFILGVIGVMSSFGWLRPLLGWTTTQISRCLDAVSNLSSSFPGQGKRGRDRS